MRTLMALRILAVAALTAASLFAVPRAARADGAHFALVIEGTSGEEQYAVLHRQWLNGLVAILRDKDKYDAAHLIVLAETPGKDEEKATADAVKAAFARLATAVGPADQLVVVLIGHGSGAGPDAKFNLVGPDLSIAEWADLVKPVRGRVAFIDTTSSSFPYLAGLSAPGRVVITATNAYAQVYHTVFMEKFLQAFSSDTADLDKNGRISLLEAFTFASRAVKEQYDHDGIMATEVALLDDTGGGKGRMATATGPDGNVASVTYLDTPAVATSTDPALQQLLTRQRELNDQLDALKLKQTSMPADEYAKALEQLLTDLATVSRDIRQKQDQRR